MQKQTVIFIAFIALVVGYVSGYLLGKPHDGNVTGMHQMPNGQMMDNNGQVMSMADMMARMNAELQGKTGDDFDKAFLNEMIMHHEGAVGMAQAALTNAKHKEIKDLGNAIISAQNKEIGSMKNWLKSWYGIEYSGTVNSAEGAPTGSIHNMPVPVGVGAARKQLAQVLKIEENKVVIMTAYEKEWSDSCLGLGGAAESCAAVITPGYEVTMQAQGKTYVYRTNVAGTVVRKEK
jgi:hypothetical protein